MHRMVKFFNLVKGDIFLVGSEEWETMAVDMPDDGTVAIWARQEAENVDFVYETFHRRVEEEAACPIYGTN